ncbi:hypothetical protein PROFUN_12847 [Planoprotostelium fungivorum]|uniref:Transcription initiation factor TFIID subunit 12 domain-containing protein n=1 Tax=Planoprotostelium fungivorum TaxID=1890364 RepID=A0A2P6N6J7_9EUKA|nr:hypothetical protein PROFUN_12847 [Planoprotostelium fungivorum]
MQGGGPPNPSIPMGFNNNAANAYALNQQQQRVLAAQQGQQQPGGVSAINPSAVAKSIVGTPVVPVKHSQMAGGDHPPAMTPQQMQAQLNQVLLSKKLQELVQQMISGGRLEVDVDEILSSMTDDFIEQATAFACKLAHHRKSSTLDLKDMQLAIEQLYGLRVPFQYNEAGSEEMKTVESVHPCRSNISRMRKPNKMTEWIVPVFKQRDRWKNSTT